VTTNLYSTAQVAELTGRAQVTIRQLAARYADSPRPLARRVGRDWLFDDEGLERARKLLPPTRMRRLPDVAP
jgi:hypothetical protein